MITEHSHYTITIIFDTGLVAPRPPAAADWMLQREKDTIMYTCSKNGKKAKSYYMQWNNRNGNLLIF